MMNCIPPATQPRTSAVMDLPGGGGGEEFSFEGNGSVAAAGREQQDLWRNANAFSRYESTLGELGVKWCIT